MLTRYRFRPAWPVTVAFVVMLPLLVGLGFWQLDRAAQKTQIRDRILARSELPAVDLNRALVEPEKMDYRRATVQGRYLADWTIYLDNRIHQGAPGYEVLTPLAVASQADTDALTADRVVLVDRGWIAWGESRSELPPVNTPARGVELAGWLRQPPDDYFTLESGPVDAAFEPLWQNLDLDRYRQATGLPVAPLVLELSPGGGGDSSLIREIPEYDDSWIERHRAYAVQWFGLALTLVVLYVVLNLKKREPDD